LRKTGISVVRFSLRLGQELNLPEDELRSLEFGALLHDIGKIGVPAAILRKPSGLTDAEWKKMREHPAHGQHILSGIEFLTGAARLVGQHHERWDGSGYPLGLRGVEIDLNARIFAVADAYDAMTSPRPFRVALDHDSAIAQLKMKSGQQFDPEIVDAFCGLTALAEIRQTIAQVSCWDARPATTRTARDDNRMPLGDLINEIKLNPVMAARALRQANLNAGVETRTADIETACARLGEEGVRAAVAGQHGTRERSADVDGLWQRSVRCADAAKRLAERSHSFAPAEAYTLGLLHDIGDFLLRALFPEEMENILWLNDAQRTDREVAAFGVDHGQVGQWIFESCGLPSHLATATQGHYDAARFTDPTALLLYLADAIARAPEPGEMAAHDALDADTLAVLHLTPQ
jgi:HD-like signal output (HDOD) protein